MCSRRPPFSRPLLLIFLIALGFVATTPPAASNPLYASLVIDANTGADVRARNADELRHPASLTKIMTLYILFQEIEAGRISKTDRITFSAHAAAQQPSEIGLKAGETITVDNAIRALVTKSANDVAAAIGEHISGTETAFAQRMTETARRLGMSKTVFRNASGLPDRAQVTTARDMTTLGLRIMRDFPDQYTIFSLKSFTYQGRTYANHNRLLGTYAGTDGIKTGYIRDSGYNLVASVHRGNRHAIAVVMGGKTGSSRDAHMRAILDESFPLLSEHFGPPPRPKPDLIAELETLFTGEEPAPAVAQAAAAAPATAMQAAGPVVAASAVQAEPVVAAVVHPAPAPAQPVAAPAAPAMPQGVVRLTMAEQPGRSRELPLTEPIAHGGVWPPGQIAAGNLIRPTEARAAVIQAAPETAMSAYQLPPDQSPAPQQVVAYAPASDGDTRVDAIESLIAAAMSEPYQASTDTRAGRLILPPRAAAPPPASSTPLAATVTPQPEALEIPPGYQIQVGAYATQSDAQARLERAQETAREELAQAMGFTPQVEQASGNILYRARFAGLDRGSAQQACKALKQRSIDCIVVAQ